MKSKAWKVTSARMAEEYTQIRCDYLALMLTLIRGVTRLRPQVTTKKGGKSVNVLKR